MQYIVGQNINVYILCVVMYTGDVTNLNFISTLDKNTINSTQIFLKMLMKKLPTTSYIKRKWNDILSSLLVARRQKFTHQQHSGLFPVCLGRFLHNVTLGCWLSQIFGQSISIFFIGWRHQAGPGCQTFLHM